MTVLPIPIRISRDSDKTPRNEIRHDSPGGDVLQRHPNLPDDVYRRVVRNAVSRETSFDPNLQNGSPTFANKEHRR